MQDAGFRFEACVLRRQDHTLLASLHTKCRRSPSSTPRLQACSTVREAETRLRTGAPSDGTGLLPRLTLSPS